MREWLHQFSHRVIAKVLIIIFGKDCFSNGSLKFSTKNHFYKIGYSRSVLVRKEISNIIIIQDHPFSRYSPSYWIKHCWCLDILRMNRGQDDLSLTDNQLVEWLTLMRNHCKTEICNAIEMDFVTEVVQMGLLTQLDLDFLRSLTFSTYMGPIHGDFHRKNIIILNGKMVLIDFDFFEVHNTHLFDYISLLVSDFWFEKKLSLFESVIQFSHLEKTSVQYDCWNQLSRDEKQCMIYLYCLWRLRNDVIYSGIKINVEQAKEVLAFVRGDRWDSN